MCLVVSRGLCSVQGTIRPGYLSATAISHVSTKGTRSMGVDINMYVEHKTPIGWNVVDDPEYTSERYKWDPADGPEIAYYDRNRDLYGLLVGRYGSVPGDEEFGAAIGVRGLPSDVSPEVREKYETSEGAESPSWLLLSEVLAMPWHKRLKHPVTGREVTYAVIAGPEFMDGVLARFSRLFKDPSTMRLVFWFLP
jgi:hypothetical protein